MNNLFKSFMSPKMKPEEPKVVNEVISDQKKEYQPRLGDANRYENSLVNNYELAEQINQEAQALAKRSMAVIEELESNPEKANFHSPVSGSRWNSHYLDDVSEELNELYGTSDPERLNGVPSEVLTFIKRYKKIKYQSPQK